MPCAMWSGASAPSLFEALLRECRDMGPTLESRVSGPLGRHGVLVWADLRPDCYDCYVMLVMYSTVPQYATSYHPIGIRIAKLGPFG